jgi:hypothetical protein
MPQRHAKTQCRNQWQGRGEDESFSTVWRVTGEGWHEGITPALAALCPLPHRAIASFPTFL